MSASYTEVSEFFVEGRDRKISHVLLHITEPSTEEEMEKGYFFALCEIAGAETEDIEILQSLIDTIEAGYYDSAQDALPSASFETALAHAERKSETLAEKKDAIHCLVGILAKDHLSISASGAPHGILFHPHKQSVHRINILEGHESDEGAALFSTVIEGTIAPGDRMIFATPNVTDFFPYDRLEKIITSRSIGDASTHMQKILEDLRGDASFGGIIIELTKKPDAAGTMAKQQAKHGSAESLEHLLQSTRRTAETLSPPLFGNLKKKSAGSNKEGLHTRHDGSRETNYRPREHRPEKERWSTMMILVIGRGLVQTAIGIGRMLKKIGTLAGRFLLVLFILITNKNNGRKEVIRSLTHTKDNIKEYIAELPLMSKFLFFGTMLLAVLFIGSLTALKIQEGRQAEAEAYAAEIRLIEEKIETAKSSMLYGDTEAAFAMIQEANGLLNGIIADTKKERGQKETLQNMIEAELVKLRKISTVSVTRIADIKEKFSDQKADKLIQIDNTLIAYGGGDQRMFAIRLGGNDVEEKKHETIGSLVSGSTPKENDTIVFIRKDGGVALLDKQSMHLNAKEITYPEENADIRDGVVYNVRLYTLDAAHNQIYRHSKIQTGYDKGSSWLKEDVVFNDPVSIAIDGDIFVLEKQGGITKLVAGRAAPFDITGLDPALKAPAEIWTYNDVDHVYILEPKEKRVVVLSKEGKLIAQYTANEWKEPTGMVVDEAGGIIYVLDDGVLYSFLMG